MKYVVALCTNPVTYAAALAILWLVSIEPLVVTGPSMRPTFEPNDRLLVETITPRLQLLWRDQPVVFIDPRAEDHPTTLKRIVGLPGETVFYHDDEVRLASFHEAEKKRFLGPVDYFLVGDNRSASTDSRDWGTIQPHEMVGLPLVRLYPWSRFEILPGWWDNENEL